MDRRRYFGTTRRLPSGRWQVRYVDPVTGRRRSAPSTFKTKGEANRWLARAESGVVAMSSLDKTASLVTLSQYGRHWMERRKLGKRTRELYEGQFRLHIEPSLGDARVARLEPHLIREWHSDISNGHLTDVTVAKVYRLLRSILNTAVEDELLDANPCRIRNGGVERSKERSIPTLDEYQELHQALPDHLAAVAAVASIGALRKGEIFGLQRRHIDLAQKTLRVEQALQEVTGEGAVLTDPKTFSSNRVVALPDYLVSILTEHLARHTGNSPDSFVFTNTRGGPVRGTVWTKAWQEARDETGQPDVRLHDLRHLGGTITAQTGATLKEIMERLGHSTVVAAMRYQHVAENRAAEIASRLDTKLNAELGHVEGTNGDSAPGGEA